MKGWQFTKTHVAPKLIEKEDPKAKKGWVVIDVKAAGLCHSDVAALEQESWMALIHAAPCIFGHECAGVISEVGAGVKNFKVGDRVGVCPIDPKTGLAVGYDYDGGYATKCAVPASCLVHIPDKVSFKQGASATDAGATSYHALFTIGEAKKGMKVGIIGIGGLGQFAARMAVLEGCEVYAVDTSPEARSLAKKIGCKKVFDNTKKLGMVKPDLIVDYAGFGTTTRDATAAVKKGGTVVLVGMGVSTFELDTMTMITNQVRLLGSIGSIPEDVAGVYEFFMKGLDPELKSIPFEDIDKGLEQLKKGKIKGRLVAEIEE
ncbi:MAG: zinc-binding dehydrogenase [Bacilli bacterium]|nr:zinc-binding dehydrogenase [Bacilli bacterium]